MQSEDKRIYVCGSDYLSNGVLGFGPKVKEVSTFQEIQTNAKIRLLSTNEKYCLAITDKHKIVVWGNLLNVGGKNALIHKDIYPSPVTINQDMPATKLFTTNFSYYFVLEQKKTIIFFGTILKMNSDEDGSHFQMQFHEVFSISMIGILFFDTPTSQNLFLLSNKDRIHPLIQNCRKDALVFQNDVLVYFNRAVGVVNLFEFFKYSDRAFNHTTLPFSVDIINFSAPVLQNADGLITSQFGMLEPTEGQTITVMGIKMTILNENGYMTERMAIQSTRGAPTPALPSDQSYIRYHEVGREQLSPKVFEFPTIRERPNMRELRVTEPPEHTENSLTEPHHEKALRKSLSCQGSMLFQNNRAKVQDHGLQPEEDSYRKMVTQSRSNSRSNIEKQLQPPKKPSAFKPKPAVEPVKKEKPPRPKIEVIRHKLEIVNKVRSPETSIRDALEGHFDINRSSTPSTKTDVKKAPKFNFLAFHTLEQLISRRAQSDFLECIRGILFAHRRIDEFATDAVKMSILKTLEQLAEFVKKKQQSRQRFLQFLTLFFRKRLIERGYFDFNKGLHQSRRIDDIADGFGILTSVFKISGRAMKKITLRGIRLAVKREKELLGQVFGICILRWLKEFVEAAKAVKSKSELAAHKASEDRRRIELLHRIKESLKNKTEQVRSLENKTDQVRSLGNSTSPMENFENSTLSMSVENSIRPLNSPRELGLNKNDFPHLERNHSQPAQLSAPSPVEPLYSKGALGELGENPSAAKTPREEGSLLKVLEVEEFSSPEKQPPKPEVQLSSSKRPLEIRSVNIFQKDAQTRLETSQDHNITQFSKPNQSDISESMDQHMRSLMDKYNADQGSFHLTETPRNKTSDNTAMHIQIVDEEERLEEDRNPALQRHAVEHPTTPVDFTTAADSLLPVDPRYGVHMPQLSIIREESCVNETTQMSVSKNLTGMILENPYGNDYNRSPKQSPVRKRPKLLEISEVKEIINERNSIIHKSQLSRRSNNSNQRSQSSLPRSSRDTPQNASNFIHKTLNSNKKSSIFKPISSTSIAPKPPVPQGLSVSAIAPSRAFKNIKFPKFEFKSNSRPHTNIFLSSKFFSRTSEKELNRSKEEPSKNGPRITDKRPFTPAAHGNPLKPFVNKLFSKLGLRSPKAALPKPDMFFSKQFETKKEEPLADKFSRWSHLFSLEKSLRPRTRAFAPRREISHKKLVSREPSGKNILNKDLYKDTQSKDESPVAPRAPDYSLRPQRPKTPAFVPKNIFVPKISSKPEWRPWVLKKQGQKGHTSFYK